MHLLDELVLVYMGFVWVLALGPHGYGTVDLEISLYLQKHQDILVEFWHWVVMSLGNMVL